MGLFGSLFTPSQASQTGVNPYNDPMTAAKGLQFLLGGYGALDRARNLNVASQAYQANQDLANSYAQPNATPANMTAANAKARALGADPTGYIKDYETANPGYAVNQTPQGWQDPNGGYHQITNGVDKLVAQPPVIRTFSNYDGSQTAAVLNPYAQGGDQSQAAPMAQQDASATPPTYAPPAGTRAARNNNPGNLRWDGKSQWQGMTGVDPQGFVQFASPEAGQRAAAINLANQQKLHGINTLTGLIQKYAPASDNNDPAAYIARVAQQTGLDPNAPLNLSDPSVQAKILPAMFGVESGGTPSPASPPMVASQAPQVAPQAAPQAGPPIVGDNPAARVLFQSQGFSNDAGGVNGADAQAIDRDAQVYNATGELPKSPGKGSFYYQLQVKRRAAELAAGAPPIADGSTLANSKLTFQANQDTLKKAQADYYDTRNNVQRLDVQSGFVLHNLSGAGPSGSPLLNIPIQLWRKNGVSSEQEAKFRQAFGTFTDDYGTIMGGGNSQLTDQKQREAQSRIDTAASQGTLGAVINQMVAEAHRAAEVKQKNYETLANTYQGGQGNGIVSAPPANASPPTKSKFVEGQIYQDKNGNKARYQGGQWVPVQ